MTSRIPGTTGVDAEDSRGPEPTDIGRNDTLLVPVVEAARLLSIDRSTVYEMLARGDLPSIKIGRRRLVSRQALIDYITRSENGRPM